MDKQEIIEKIIQDTNWFSEGFITGQNRIELYESNGLIIKSWNYLGNSDSGYVSYNEKGKLSFSKDSLEELIEITKINGSAKIITIGKLYDYEFSFIDEYKGKTGILEKFDFPEIGKVMLTLDITKDKYSFYSFHEKEYSKNK